MVLAPDPDPDPDPDPGNDPGHDSDKDPDLSKTLILILIMIFRGSIHIDNVDISHLDLDELREHLAVIPQQPFLFRDQL